MLVEWYVARTNQIATLGYVSRTSYVIAFGYLTVFHYCFLVNDVMESGDQKFWTHLISEMVCGLGKSLVD